MDAKQVELVQTSFQQVKPMADLAAEMFYNRLFEVAPQVRHMFKNDLRKQGAMLMTTLGLAVENLHDVEKILPAVRLLGERHAGYGAKPEHFAVVGECLIWTLEQAFGDAFTPDLKEAWIDAYSMLALVMQDAMEERSLVAA